MNQKPRNDGEKSREAWLQNEFESTFPGIDAPVSDRIAGLQASCAVVKAFRKQGALSIAPTSIEEAERVYKALVAAADFEFTPEQFAVLAGNSSLRTLATLQAYGLVECVDDSIIRVIDQVQ